MSGFALSLVLLAALLHAFWNAMVKGAGDRALVLGGVALAHALVGLGLVGFTEAPARESWPFILASTLIHWVYYATLFTAYRLGDLSQVYPIARGIAPMLVAVGALVFAGERLSPAGWAGVAIVSLGIGALALGRGAARASRGAVLAALSTGVLIASYSVADGIGIRASGSPFGYMAWLFLLELPVIAFVLLRRRLANGRWTVSARSFGVGLGGGLFAVTAYGLVLYAKTIAPLAAVSAVRESSVIFAALIGVLLFSERPWQRRVCSAIAVAGGVILLARAA